MTKTLNKVRLYRGYNIYPVFTFGKLPWSAKGPHGYLSADTLEGIKALIRDSLK